MASDHLKNYHVNIANDTRNISNENIYQKIYF